MLHVNVGGAPGARDIALVRSFHGARFLTHDKDFYLENVHCEGGITGGAPFLCRGNAQYCQGELLVPLFRALKPAVLQDARRGAADGLEVEVRLQGLLWLAEWVVHGEVLLWVHQP